MRRPGPLQELPLEQFLPPNPNLPYPPKSRPNKRPLSPGGPNLFSPAKRRILNEEGVFSPDKTFKSPVSGRDAPARFAQVLTGPESPARKLDFGIPKRRLESPALPRMSIINVTPTRSTSSSSKLAPSPKFKSTPRSFSSRPGDDQEMDDYFSHPSSSSLTPPLTDPQSMHYPGFRVYHDTGSSATLFDEGLQSLNLGDDKEKDSLKENVVPRRKRRTATAPTPDLKLQLFSPDPKRMGKVKSTPATPKKVFGVDRQELAGSPTPRRPVPGTIWATTISTPKPTEKEKKGMRIFLQDEVEIDEEDEIR